MITAPSNLSPAEPLEFELTAANPLYPQPVTGTYVFCLEADEDFEMAINKGGFFPFGSNRSFEMPPGTEFRHLTIRRKAGAAVDPNPVRLIVGTGKYSTATFALAAAVTLAAGQTVKVTPPTTLVTPADLVLVANTNTLAFAANANATRRTIRNTSATSDIRVSTTAADLTAGKGKLVKAGEEWETAVSGALYVRSTGTPTLVLAEESF